MTTASQRSIIYPCWLRVAVGKDPMQIIFLMENIQKYEGVAEVVWSNSTHRHGLPVAVIEARFKNRTACEAFAGSLPPSINIQEPVVYSNAVYIRAQIAAAYEDALAGILRLNAILDRYDGVERTVTHTRWIQNQTDKLSEWRTKMDEATSSVIRHHGGIG